MKTRRIDSSLVLILIAPAIVAMVVASSCGAAQRRVALDASAKTLRAASVTFATWSDKREHEILADVHDRAEFDRRIAEHRAKVDRVNALFAAAFAALEAAASDATADRVEAGFRAVTELVQLVQEAMGP